MTYLVRIMGLERHDLETFGQIFLERQVGIVLIKHGHVVIHVFDQDGHLQTRGNSISTIAFFGIMANERRPKNFVKRTMQVK